MDYTNYYINKYNNSTLKTDFETTAVSKLQECYDYLKNCYDTIINNESLSDDARSNDANSICGKLNKYYKMLDPNATGEDTIKGKISKKAKEIKANAEKCDGWYQKYKKLDQQTPQHTEKITSDTIHGITVEIKNVNHETTISSNGEIQERTNTTTTAKYYNKDLYGHYNKNTPSYTSPAVKDFSEWITIAEMNGTTQHGGGVGNKFTISEMNGTGRYSGGIGKKF